MLRRPSPFRHPISSRSNPFESTGPRHPGERASVNALTSYVPSPQDGKAAGKAQKLSFGDALVVRLFAYTH